MDRCDFISRFYIKPSPSPRTISVLADKYKNMSSFGDKMREIEERAKDGTTEVKKNIKNDWAQTKADAEKAKNELDADVDKM